MRRCASTGTCATPRIRRDRLGDDASRRLGREEYLCDPLFRKFSYIEQGGTKFSVYGPQIIGRGLRRVNALGKDWEQCHVVDHPIFKHDWLWEMLRAYKYEAPLNPGDVIDDAKT